MGIFLQQIATGFIVKTIASFDDTLTRIPILAELTKLKSGKIAFSIGTLLALTTILIPVLFFSHILNAIPYRQYFIAILIFILGISVYLELLTPKEEKIQHKLIQSQATSHVRFLKLISIGFIVSLITYLDDMVVLIPLFLGDNTTRFLSVIGIYLAALLQIIIVIYFSKQLSQIKYKKELASGALMILSLLVGFGIV